MNQSNGRIEYYYEVLEAEDILTLKNLVTPMLHDGYELIGGVSAYAYRDSSGDLRTFYCQAVIKKVNVLK